MTLLGRDGQPLPPDAPRSCRRYVDREAALAAWQTRRLRFDDRANLAAASDGPAPSAAPMPWRGETLLDVKLRTAKIAAEEAAIRLAVRRGELAPKAAVEMAIGDAAMALRHIFESLPMLTEEAHAVASREGVPGLFAWLRAKGRALAGEAADRLAAVAGELGREIEEGQSQDDEEN